VYTIDGLRGIHQHRTRYTDEVELRKMFKQTWTTVSSVCGRWKCAVVECGIFWSALHVQPLNVHALFEAWTTCVANYPFDFSISVPACSMDREPGPDEIGVQDIVRLLSMTACVCCLLVLDRAKHPKMSILESAIDSIWLPALECFRLGSSQLQTRI
jgi:hypothetical protein